MANIGPNKAIEADALPARLMAVSSVTDYSIDGDIIIYSNH